MPKEHMKCEECGREIYLVVDGRHMTEAELMHYDRIPKSIIWHLDHELWCSRREKRLDHGLPK